MPDTHPTPRPVGNQTRHRQTRHSGRPHPGTRPSRTDPARALALSVLRDIRLHGGYANLVLPARLGRAGLRGRDAALATTLVYGSLRWQGFLDAVIDAVREKGRAGRPAAGGGQDSPDRSGGHRRSHDDGRDEDCDNSRDVSRDDAVRGTVGRLDPWVRDILRLGAYQLLFLDIPAYAAVSTSCDLARAGRPTRAAVGLVDALLRAVARRPRAEWGALLTSRIDRDRPLERLAVRTSHPLWIVRELARSRAAAGYETGWPEGAGTVTKSDLVEKSDERAGAVHRAEIKAGAKTGTEEGAAAKAGVHTDAKAEAVWSSLSRDCRRSLLTLLEADNADPDVTLCARPGLVARDALLRQARAVFPQATVALGRYSPYAVRTHGVEPARLAAVAAGTAGVEDEGSQLAVIALASAPLDPLPASAGAVPSQPDSDPASPSGPDLERSAGGASGHPHSGSGRWLDLCAGPGGKAALLGSIAALNGARLVANEPQGHRARLVEENLRALPAGTVEAVTRLDGRDYGRPAHDGHPGTQAVFDRVLVDAPCSGLGALRRRPEARWTKKPDDIADLSALQRGLLSAGLDATRHGGVLAYVTCSPVLEETRRVVDAVLDGRDDAGRLDTAAILRSALPGTDIPLPSHGDVQLFSDLHDTDMMFICLIRRR